MSEARPQLIFVYNADSGLFNTLTDIAHKLLSPQTYACNLCKLTHTALHARKEWKEFIASSPLPLDFVHRDELATRYGVKDVVLPAVLLRTHSDQGEDIRVWLDAERINACATLEDLQALIRGSLAELGIA